jgi:hypothetical protein
MAEFREIPGSELNVAPGLARVHAERESLSDPGERG